MAAFHLKVDVSGLVFRLAWNSDQNPGAANTTALDAANGSTAGTLISGGDLGTATTGAGQDGIWHIRLRYRE